MKQKDLDKAEGVLQRMEKAGVQANTITYGALFQGCRFHLPFAERICL
jgi:pentatricopeptide repeat protein